MSKRRSAESPAGLCAARPPTRPSTDVRAATRTAARDRHPDHDDGPFDILFNDEVGYRIDASETRYRRSSFEPNKVATLALAARAWSTAGASPAPHRRAAQAPPARAWRSTSPVTAGAEPASAPRSRPSRPVHAACVGAAADHLRLPQERRRADDAARAAVGAEELARPLVPHRFTTSTAATSGRSASAVSSPGPWQGRAGRTPSRPTTCPRWPSRRSCPSPRAPPSSACATGAAHAAPLRRAHHRGRRAWAEVEVPYPAARPSATSSRSARTPWPCRRPSSSSRPLGLRAVAGTPRVGTGRRSLRAPTTTNGEHRHERSGGQQHVDRRRRRRSVSAACSTWCPWLLQHRGVPISEAAREFGVTRTGRRGPRAAVRLRHTRATATPSSSTPSGTAATSTSTTPTTSRPPCA